MHIAFLSPEYVTLSSVHGGLANYLRKVGLALSERGHKVSIIYLSDQDRCSRDGPITLYEVKRFRAPGWVSNITLFRPFLALLEFLMTSKRMASEALYFHRLSPFDIVQASSYRACGYFLLNNGLIPTVCRISSNSHVYRMADGKKNSFIDRMFDLFETIQVQRADASFSPSELMAKSFTNPKQRRVSIIRTPLPNTNIEEDESFYNEKLLGKRYLLYFGQMSRKKGTDQLDYLIPIIHAEWEDIWFVFIGRDDGLPNGKKMTEHILDQEGVDKNRILFCDGLPHAQLFPVIKNAAAVLMPSRVDNYPNACLESLALGTPVIGTFGSSLDEIITDGETGFLCKNDDQEDLCRAAKKMLLRSQDEIESMRHNIEFYVKSIYSEDRISQLIDFYEQTIREFKYKH